MFVVVNQWIFMIVTEIKLSNTWIFYNECFWANSVSLLNFEYLSTLVYSFKIFFKSKPLTSKK